MYPNASACKAKTACLYDPVAWSTQESCYFRVDAASPFNIAFQYILMGSLTTSP